MAGPTTWGYQNVLAGVKPAAASTTFITVRVAEFDSDDDCACSLTDTYALVDDDSGGGGAGIEPSVDDWISMTDGMNDYCVQVTAINQESGMSVYFTSAAYADCDACNAAEEICSEGGGPPGP